MMRVAALSDLHLGSRTGPGLAWAVASIDAAVRDGAGLLVLAGDLVDRHSDDQAFQEAEHLLRYASGLGLPVVGVWGNHDAAAGLPARMPEIDGVRFASSDRVDEFVVGPLVVHAVSVAADPDPRSLVQQFPVVRPGDGPHLGILHTSLTGERSRSVCLPTTREELESRGYERWILGHVHRPTPVADGIGWVGMGRLLVEELGAARALHRDGRGSGPDQARIQHSRR